MVEKNVALALSSGGARGMAHIGVIEEIISRGYNITSIAGCSAGALIGGVYATGHLEEFKHWACNLEKLDVLKLIDLTFNKQGIIKGDKVFAQLKEMIGNPNIETLPIHFVAIAADVIKKREIVFETGRLLTALRASIAMPSILKPVKYERTSLLIDGALINPLPIDRVKRSKNDIVIAVNLNSSIPYIKPHIKIRKETPKSMLDRAKLKLIEERTSLFDRKKNTVKNIGFYNIITTAISMLEDKLTESTINTIKPDILINVSRLSGLTFDFHRSEELIEIGRESAIKEFNIFKQ